MQQTTSKKTVYAGFDNTGRRVLLGASSLLVGLMSFPMLRPEPVTASASLQETQIADEPTCRTCSIRLAPVAELGASEGDGLIDDIRYRAARDHAGRYYLYASDADVGHVKVFASDGRFRTRIGRPGEGPGEFKTITALTVGPGQRILIVDRENGRLTTYSPTYELIESVRLTFRPGFTIVAFPGDRVIIPGVIRTPERAGWPLHVVGFSGAIDRSFGSDTGALLPGDVQVRRIARAVAVHNDAEETEAVWSMTPREFSAELWSIAGSLLQRITRNSEWFDQAALGDGITGPRPAITAVHQTPDGLLWMFVQVADERWEQQVQASPDDEFHGGRFVGRLQEYYDTVVEVIDPKDGTLLARDRFDQSYLRPISDSQIGGVTEDEDFELTFQVWELQIERH